MTLDARATRGGPVPARVVLALFCLSLTVLFGFGTGGDTGGNQPEAAVVMADAAEPAGTAEKAE